MREKPIAKDCVVYINWDGFAWEYFALANRDGIKKTPVINELARHGVLFTNAWTGIPSITNPMQAAVVSGAWPSITGNCYCYYDKKKNMVFQFKRENKAETIAEAVVRQGLNAASIHQFALENRGTAVGDPENPYIQVGNNADYKARFDAAIQLIRGEPVATEYGNIQLNGIPSLLAIYMDDLDGIGHNDKSTYGVPRVDTEEKRIANVIGRLEQMDRKLGEFVNACKTAGIYERMTFVLTTDHGMVPYGRQGKGKDKYGFSKLKELVRTIRQLGFKAEVLKPGKGSKPDTDIVLVSTGMEVQLYFTREYADRDVEKIIGAVEGKEFVGQIVKKEELLMRGAMEDFADLLISSRSPYCFTNDFWLHKAGGLHDSLDERAQHIFAMMWGRGVKEVHAYSEKIYNIDFAMTIAKLLGIEGPLNARGQVLTDILSI